MIFRARHFEFVFPCPTLVMGVVNVTPDSFYDGGRFFETPRAVAHALQLVKEGAGILDIGGESTRPDASQISEVEEMSRVLPVIRELSAHVKIPISIDTMKPAVARAALKAGASIVNDVAANRNDKEMLRVVAEMNAGYICVHMQGTSQTMQINPVYTDVVREIGDFFSNRVEVLKSVGISADHVVLDVGIGFGKTVEHNLRLLGQLQSFKKLKRPLLLGVSRKSFIGKIFGTPVSERLPASLACACRAVEAGVQIIRAHDVAETVQAIRMFEIIRQSRNC
jgi:dihydropteroate synthase